MMMSTRLVSGHSPEARRVDIIIHTEDSFMTRIERIPADVYLVDGKMKHVKSTQIAQRLQSVARTIGRSTLGLDPNSIGTHSLRCSLALLLHLAGKSDSYIKLHCRWLSLAFMTYIKRQIAQLDDDTLQKITNSSVLNFLQISINN